MKIEVIPAPKLDYDPYEEDVAGAHKGETLVITDGPPHALLEIKIEEGRSGIGNEFKIKCFHNGKFVKHLGVVFVDDDNEFVHVEKR